MKNQNKIMAIGATCLIFLISCEPEEITKVEDQVTFEQTQTSMSGEDMFREIVLMQGTQVSERIPQYAEFVDLINRQPEESIKNRIESNEEIIEKINELDPDYFTNFGIAIKGDNPYEIERELDNAGVILETTINLIVGYDGFVSEASLIAENIALNYDFSDDEQIELYKADVLAALEIEFPEIELGDNYDSGRCIAVIDAIVHANVMVVLNYIHVAANFVVHVNWFLNIDTERGGINHGLERDQLIATIIKNY